METDLDQILVLQMKTAVMMMLGTVIEFSFQSAIFLFHLPEFQKKINLWPLLLEPHHEVIEVQKFRDIKKGFNTVNGIEPNF